MTRRRSSCQGAAEAARSTARSLSSNAARAERSSADASGPVGGRRRRAAVLPWLRVRDGCRRPQLLQRRPLLCKRARQIEAREAALLDEDLADPGAALTLRVERGFELGAADEAELHEDLAEWTPNLHLGWGQRLDRGDRSLDDLGGLPLGLLELCPLLGEHARELEPRHAELGDDDLSQPFTRFLLHLQRALQLLTRDQILLHEDGADQARLDRRSCFHLTPIGSHSFEV